MHFAKHNFLHKKDLLIRYKALCPATWPNYPGSEKDGVAVLCNHLQYQEDDYRLGRYENVNNKKFSRGKRICCFVSEYSDS